MRIRVIEQTAISREPIELKKGIKDIIFVATVVNVISETDRT